MTSLGYAGPAAAAMSGAAAAVEVGMLQGDLSLGMVAAAPLAVSLVSVVAAASSAAPSPKHFT